MEDESEQSNHCRNAFERIAKLMSKNLLDKMNNMEASAVEYTEDGSVVINIEDREIIPTPEDYDGHKLLAKLRRKSALDEVR
jgi:hypothetical protein